MDRYTQQRALSMGAITLAAWLLTGCGGSGAPAPPVGPGPVPPDPPALTAANPPSGWTQSGGNQFRSHSSASNGPLNPLETRLPLLAGASGTPQLCADGLWRCRFEHEVAAFDGTGAVTARWPLGLATSGELVLSPDGSCFYVIAEGCLHALGLDGQRLWTSVDLGLQRDPVCVDGGRIVCVARSAGDPSGFHVFEADGSSAWSLAAQFDGWAIAPSGRVFFATSATQELRSADNGVERPVASLAHHFIYRMFIGADGRLYVETFNPPDDFNSRPEYLEAFSLDGTRLGVQLNPTYASASRVAPDGRRFHASFDSPGVTAHDVSGGLLWTCDGLSDISRLEPQPDGSVLVHGENDPVQGSHYGPGGVGQVGANGTLRWWVEGGNPGAARRVDGGYMVANRQRLCGISPSGQLEFEHGLPGGKVDELRTDARGGIIYSDYTTLYKVDRRLDLQWRSFPARGSQEVLLGGGGQLVVPSYNNYQVFSGDGQPVSSFELDQPEYSGPRSGLVGPDGAVYAARQSTGRVEAYTPAGELRWSDKPPGEPTGHAALDANGHLFVTTVVHEIRYGSVTMIAPPTVPVSPALLEYGPDGKLRKTVGLPSLPLGSPQIGRDGLVWQSLLDGRLLSYNPLTRQTSVLAVPAGHAGMYLLSTTPGGRLLVQLYPEALAIRDWEMFTSHRGFAGPVAALDVDGSVAWSFELAGGGLLTDYFVDGEFRAYLLEQADDQPATLHAVGPAGQLLYDYAIDTPAVSHHKPAIRDMAPDHSGGLVLACDTELIRLADY